MQFYKQPRRTNPGQGIAMVLNFTMSLAYLACGVYLFASPAAGKIMPPEYIHTVAVCLCLYGFFRLFRVYHQYRKPSHFQ